ncbi:Tn3 family transposase [Streptomyces sp. NPDC046862]|uniref:Tn3 family transposase n=1 Tax=Streptomyces sp. NPDC046862 TaxID=3154603 RepID=UPI0034551312
MQHLRLPRVARARRNDTRTGQEGQPGALGLVLNPVVCWMSRYPGAAVEGVRALPADERERDVLDEDVARVSPLKLAHLNVLGRYGFCASTSVDGGLPSLRDPPVRAVSTGTRPRPNGPRRPARAGREPRIIVMTPGAAQDDVIRCVR